VLVCAVFHAPIFCATKTVIILVILKFGRFTFRMLRTKLFQRTSVVVYFHDSALVPVCRIIFKYVLYRAARNKSDENLIMKYVDFLCFKRKCMKCKHFSYLFVYVFIIYLTAIQVA
jgi:hypothetical protein